MAKFTIFCRDASNTGTTYITAVDAPDIEAAKRLGLEECAEEWGRKWTRSGCSASPKAM